MISRRDFLKGVGAAAAAGAALPSVLAEEKEAKAGSTRVQGPGPVPIVLDVDGKKRRLTVEPRVTLLDALREHLGVTGPKKACDRGGCGACTVLRDDEPVCACSLLAIECQGVAITTIEGLGDHALKAEFVAHDALQCGFCTPGMITSIAGLLKRRPDASIAEIRAAVAGNLCRCGTYPHVFEAALAAVRAGKGR